MTSLTFINEDVQGHIMTAASDGVVRIYRNYDPETAFEDYPIELSTAWRALPELIISKRRSGVVTDWLQPYGILVVGGDSKVIKIWDCHKEMSMAVCSQSVCLWLVDVLIFAMCYRLLRQSALAASPP